MDDLTFGPGLQYGNPGPATYSSANQSWHFARRFRPSQIITYTGYKQQVVTPSTDNFPIANSHDPAVKSLSADYPELTGITSTFAGEEALSQAIQEAESYFNPQISTLLDFGNAHLAEAVRLRHGRMRTVPIVASASGPNGNVLSLRTVGTEKVVTDLEHDAAFRVPSLCQSLSVDWVCSHTPIRQVKFAESLENLGDLLAVRLLSSTAIFHPIYSRDAHQIEAPEISGLDFSTPQVSHINPCLVAEIDISQTGGFTHVDATFNPWYSKQCAILDERGYWTVWQLADLDKIGTGLEPELLYSGHLPSDTAQDDSSERSAAGEENCDTWGRCEWVRDVNTFIVCGRRNAVLYVSEGATTTSHAVQLNWQSSTEWIVDIKVCSVRRSLVFILTTWRILCFDFKDDGPDAQSYSPQYTWLHARDAEDLTLKVTSLTIGEEYYLLLYSRLDSCVLAFQVSIEEYDDGNYSMSDPFFIYVPGVTDTHGLKTTRYKFPVKQLVFKEIEQQIYLSKRVSLERCPRFMKLFMLGNDLAVHEYLYSKPSNQSSAEEIKFGAEALFSNAVSLLPNKQKRKGDRQSSLGLSDSDIDEISDADDMAQTHSDAFELYDIGTAVDFAKIYDLLISGQPHYIKSSRPAVAYQSFREYVEGLVAQISALGEDGPSFLHTMLDITDNPPVLSDIEDSSLELDWLRTQFAAMEPSAETALCFLPLNSSSRDSPKITHSLRSIQPMGALRLYEWLMRNWLSTLSRRLPSWIRISKEKLIRQLSIELSLASTLHVEVSGSDDMSAVSSQSPVATRSNSTIDQPDRVGDGPDMPAENNAIKHDILNLKIVSPTSMGIALGGCTQDILSFWDLGGDPESFDWEQAMATETTPQPESRSSSRSKSEQRKRTRSQSRANSVGSPVAPSMQFPGSQPQFEGRRLPVRSSQVVPSSQVTDHIPMTQVERGVFGGRQSAKRSSSTKRKKRAAGF